MAKRGLVVREDTTECKIHLQKKILARVLGTFIFDVWKEFHRRIEKRGQNKIARNICANITITRAFSPLKSI